MPNWVTNKVKFKSRGREIIDKIVKVDNDKEELFSEDVLFDFNKIIPRPKTLNITSGGNDKYAMQYALLKMNAPQLGILISSYSSTLVYSTLTILYEDFGFSTSSISTINVKPPNV